MTGKEPAWIGLDATEPIKNLAIADLKRAAEDGLILDYKFPTDTRDEHQMTRLATNLPEGTPLPGTDTGYFYLFHIADAAGARRRVVVGEDEVLAAMFILALVKGDPELARKYEIRPGMLS